jgi:hypothetical protein
MRKIATFTALAGAVALAGCGPSEQERASDAAGAVRSVIESVETAPKVAEQQGGWPSTAFEAGAASVTAFSAQDGGYRYTLEATANDAVACFGALTAAYRGAKTVSLNGRFHSLWSLVPHGARGRVYPAGNLCASASLPARIVAVRETDGKGPVREMLGGYLTYRDTE